MPRTANGKTDRAALPAPSTAGGAPAGSGAVGNLTEFRLMSLFLKILPATGIAVDDDFFEAGGHSLAAVRLIAAIETEFGARLPVAILFRAPTVRLLAVLDSPELQGHTVPVHGGFAAASLVVRRAPFKSGGEAGRSSLP
jgi:acyl carrier protein